MLDAGSGACHHAPVLVLGIDPGTRRCGYGIVARAGGGFKRFASGVIVPGELPNAERLGAILAGPALPRHRPGGGGRRRDRLGALPALGAGLGQARGVVLAAAAQAGLPVFEYAPGEVKRAFTGSGRAEKAQMVRTARALFGVEAKLADEADALAVAVCHLARGAAQPVRRGPAPPTRAEARGGCARQCAASPSGA